MSMLCRRQFDYKLHQHYIADLSLEPNLARVHRQHAEYIQYNMHKYI